MMLSEEERRAEREKRKKGKGSRGKREILRPWQENARFQVFLNKMGRIPPTYMKVQARDAENSNSRLLLLSQSLHLGSLPLGTGDRQQVSANYDACTGMQMWAVYKDNGIMQTGLQNRMLEHFRTCLVLN